MKDKQKVLVYSKADCPACRQTDMFLKRNSIYYNEIPLADSKGNLYNEEDEDLLADFRAKGYQQFPVVEVLKGSTVYSWSGFQPSKLNKLIKKA